MANPEMNEPHKKSKYLTLTYINIAVYATAISASIFLLLLILRAAVSAPFKDELQFSSLFRSTSQGQWPPLLELISAHNGHPYFILKSLFSFTILHHLPWTWMMFAQVPLIFISFLIAWKSIAPTDKNIAIITGITLALLIITPRQWENLYWSLQIAFALALVFSLYGFSQVQRYLYSLEKSHLYYALIALLLATISNGSGIIALSLACIVLFFTGPTNFSRRASAACLIVGVFIFSISLYLSSKKYAGSMHFSFYDGFSHVLIMLSNAWLSVENEPTKLATGSLFLIFLVFFVNQSIRKYQEYMFELLCIALSTILILGITISRLGAGINQPDAPRYVPLVIPAAIGCVLLIARGGHKRILFLCLAVSIFSFLSSATSEWKITPYRHNNLAEELHNLCTKGIISNADGSLYGDAESIANLQRVFCQQ
ncbi:MAG TPA: hypothetical protein VNT00_08295 [Eoetvoesiella sp.]|uniref:hypothetical protein n=1 Tax=Eoetvoesiella sp. TaxID=1966355 RepID=UPI002BB9D9B8|nr:hypothetical protein [Eoetvoesiella sp.]HWK61405.1 hypothetical protein [Eoetvoesiella sp.]